MTRYVHMQSKTMNPLTLAPDEMSKARRSWLCTGCVLPLPGTGPIDIHIQEDKPDSALSFVSGCGVSVARRDLLGLFGQERMDRDLILGEVMDSDGVILDDWITFMGRTRCPIRGTKNVSLRRCEDCGRILYFATGKRHICPVSSQGHELWESDLNGLVVPEELYDSISFPGAVLKRVSSSRLEMVTDTRDGLPLDLAEADSGD